MDERVEDIPITAPTFPWELCLRNATVFYQRLPDGGMLVKFAPVSGTPQGMMPMAPAVEVAFNADGWQRFKDEINADGAKSPIVVAGPGMIPKMNGNGGSGI